MENVTIRVIIPAEEGNACPTREALHELANRKVFAMAVAGGYFAEGTTVFPCDVEMLVRPTPDQTGYEVTGMFDADTIR